MLPRKEAGDILCPFPLSGISGLLFDSSFLFPLSFFCWSSYSFSLVIVLHMVRSSAFFSFLFLFLQKILRHFSFRVRLFSMTLVEHLEDDSW